MTNNPPHMDLLSTLISAGGKLAMGTIGTIGSDATQIAPEARLITRRSAFALLRKIRYAVAIQSEKRRGRAILRTMTDDQLWDIGLTRREAEGEASKSFFWD